MGKVRLVSGPPRSFAIPTGASSDPRVSYSQKGDVVLALHPTSQLLAVVSSTNVTLWMHSYTRTTGASTEPVDSILDTLSDEKGQDAHYLFSFPRNASEKAHRATEKGAVTVWAYWIASLQLLVAESGATNWEMYEFSVDHARSDPRPFSARLTTYSTAKIIGKDDISSFYLLSTPQDEDEASAFLTLVTNDSIPINSNQGQDQTQSGNREYISSMAVVDSSCVFLGLSSGFLIAIHLPDLSAPQIAASASWKIDLRPHFASGIASSPPACCIALSCGSISDTVFVVACSPSQCVLLELNIPLRQFKSSVSLPEPLTATRLVSCALYTQQTCLLAIGLSTSQTHVFQVENATSSASNSLHPIATLSLESEGYCALELGSVVSIAWAGCGDAIAVGYEKRGFSLFSIDGRRIMSSFPSEYQPVSQDKEACYHGAFQVAWALQDSLLLVTPLAHRTLRDYEPEELYTELETQLYKDEDGFCMSLSGALGRYGAWVRSYSPRPSNQETGSASRNGQIEPGDLILSLEDANMSMELVNVPFHEVVARFKAIPSHTYVSVRLLRLEWEAIYTLLTAAVDDNCFCNQNLIQILREDSDLHARLVALRMQNRRGDYADRWDSELGHHSSSPDELPRYIGAWKVLHGTSCTISRQKFVKFIFSVFPTWNPIQILTKLADFSKRMKRPRSPTLLEYSVMHQVPISGISSCLLFLQASSVYVAASRALESPWKLSTGDRYNVPPTYAHALPLRLAAFSKDSHQLAVAGQRGFCVLNLLTGKWRGFGNVAQELDRFVTALSWLTEDVIVVALTKLSENHERVHLEAYPRDHLDVDARVAWISLSSHPPAFANSANKDACVLAMEAYGPFLYCFGSRTLWRVRVAMDANVDPFSVCESRYFPCALAGKMAQEAEVFGSISTFSLVPRLVDLVHSDKRNESNESSWISSMFQSLIHGQAPEQYENQDVFPRFIFHDSMRQELVLWDPEARWMYVVARNVIRAVFFHLPVEECPKWPLMLQYFVGIHSTFGLQIWFPLLDGVYGSPSASFTKDVHSLRLFLLCQDPLRSVTHELEFGSAWPTWELYQQVLCEYGLHLDGKKNVSSQSVSIASPKAIHNDAFVALQMTILDGNVTIEEDSNVLGIESHFGVMVNISQDTSSMVASDACSSAVYDAFVRVHPILHVAMEVAVCWNQWKWVEGMLQTLWETFPFASATTEMLLWVVVEGFHAGKYSEEQWKQVLSLLQPRDWDGEEAIQRDFALGVDEYCEIIAQLARKCERSRQKLIFPLAGDPQKLISICQRRKQLSTAANFLILLEVSNDSDEADDETMGILAFRNDTAIDLVEMCLNEKEWKLAEELVRVVRRWQIVLLEGKSGQGRKSLDEMLAGIAFGDLEGRNFERLAWICDHLQAKLPPNGRDTAESDLQEEEMERISMELHERFIATHRAIELRYLSQAFQEAAYNRWSAVVRNAFEKMFGMRHKLNAGRCLRFGRFCSSQTASEAETHMRTKLMDSLKATDVQVTDVSGGCGSMYNVKVVSSQFEGKSRVIQHRMVNEVLKDEIKGMHGLTIKTSTPS
uniref:Uncharacterized protein AlNc14C23G2367 n=1 Tax=Albugo laibachii Nc14 TaxID=890382 RepID=F0W668_9STRA|nr:conserved hypothetical protein [Albugo laibachii Nc14]|eukprot:CCA16610.1 conserved hypothetical protein [Albugo laibachii Nc14]